jgi:hypothetical protein
MYVCLWCLFPGALCQNVANVIESTKEGGWGWGGEDVRGKDCVSSECMRLQHRVYTCVRMCTCGRLEEDQGLDAGMSACGY